MFKPSSEFARASDEAKSALLAALTRRTYANNEVVYLQAPGRIFDRATRPFCRRCNHASRFASHTTLQLFFFSCAYGASLLDSCAIIFHKPHLDNIPIGSYTYDCPLP